MFTGIVETQGIVRKIVENGGNKTFWIKSPISAKLSPDQSVAHDGVCLTVEEVKNSRHKVTAIAETLSKTNLGAWQEGTLVNLERCLRVQDRLDGHFVQGHVDTVSACIAKRESDGSWQYTFRIPSDFNLQIIEKGSVTINGISLTAFNVTSDTFDVAIIPYTYDNTNIGNVIVGQKINIEFDMIGKYINRYLKFRQA